MRTRLISGIVAGIVALGAAIPAVGLANSGSHHPTTKGYRYTAGACNGHKRWGRHRGHWRGRKRGFDHGRKCGFKRIGQTGATGYTGQTGHKGCTGQTGQTGWTDTTKHQRRWS